MRRGRGDQHCLECLVYERLQLIFAFPGRLYQRVDGESAAKEGSDLQGLQAGRAQCLEALPYRCDNTIRQLCAARARCSPLALAQLQLGAERLHTHQFFQKEGIALGAFEQRAGGFLWNDAGQQGL